MLRRFAGYTAVFFTGSAMTPPRSPKPPSERKDALNKKSHLRVNQDDLTPGGACKAIRRAGRGAATSVSSIDLISGALACTACGNARAPGPGVKMEKSGASHSLNHWEPMGIFK
jgi:hypothetical protein